MGRVALPARGGIGTIDETCKQANKEAYMSDVIQVVKEGPIATVVLNRPERMNALNLPVWQGLAQAFEALADDHSVRAIVLRGAGTKAFAPGADIEEFDTLRADAAQAKAYDLVMRRALDAVSNCPQPVVALIFGPCVGGGLELACCCDLRISARSGRFGVPINKISDGLSGTGSHRRYRRPRRGGGNPA
jgi:enoyl-CoA hydratase